MIPFNHLKEIFLADTPLIDVRAPVEFHQGSLPGAVNLPILNDDERALVGTTYKLRGQEEAVKLGHQMISGEVKESRLQAWKSFIESHPEAVLYCFRGGKRSQITQQWLHEQKIDRPLIQGGYKAARTFLMESIGHYCMDHSLIVITGPTGSGKTRFLNDLSRSLPVLDLEKIAAHRGSAFGSLETPQPSQSDFENRVAVELLKQDAQFEEKNPLVLEDESRFIGSRYLPMPLFTKMRLSKVVWIVEDLAERVQNIFADYIQNTSIGYAVQAIPRCAEENEILTSEALKTFARYKNAVHAIHKKLGGQRAQEVLADLQLSESEFISCKDLSSNRVWIEKLLCWYYDPLYLGSLEKRQPEVLFKGSFEDSLEFLKKY